MSDRTIKTCSTEGCDNIVSARGVCNKHYQNLRAQGKFGLKKCKYPTCDRHPTAKGYCNKHYKRWKKNGDTPGLRPIPTTPIELFDQRTRSTENGCIEWTSPTDSEGYCYVYIDGKRKYAHRFSWEIFVGPIPQGQQIDHKCFNRRCVNVKHLRQLSPAENSQHQQGPNAKNTSGYRGVFWNDAANKYQAVVSSFGRKYYLGVFESAKEAGIAAAKKRLELGFPQSDHDRQLIAETT